MCDSTKELGNKYFKEGKFEDALSLYTKGLKMCDDKDEKLAYLKNKSVCYLKLEKYNEAIKACDTALEINPHDEKSLYRRCQANQKLNNSDSAFTDAKKLFTMFPKNKLYQTTFIELQKIVKAKVDHCQSFIGKTDAMFESLKQNETSEEDKIKYINNLTALSRESNTNYIWKHSSIDILFAFCNKDQPLKVIEAAQRCLSSLTSKSIDQSLELFIKHGPQYFADMIYSNNSEHCRLTGLYLEAILSGLTQLKQYKKDKEKFDEEQRVTCGKMYPKRYQKYKIDEGVEKYVTECFMTLIKAVNSKRLSAVGRDSILEIMIRFIPSKEGVNWSRSLLKTDGALVKLLEVGAASHRTGIKSESVAKSVSLIETSERTKMSIAILLAAVYDDLISDQERDKFRDICSEFVIDLLSDDMIESKVEAANMIGLLFQGPYEVGSSLLGRAGILEGLLLLLSPHHQQIPSYRRVALDALIHACTKRDKCQSVIKEAVPVLEQVYRDSANDDVMKLMALVGLCKLGVAGGRDASYSMQGLADGSNLELAKCCRKFLLTSASQTDTNNKSLIRRWAAEGLAFLTLDAEVKEILTEDKRALQALLAVDMKSSPECLYPMATVLMNLTNSYEKTDILPEMIELAKYAKQHVPETSEKDGVEFIAKRINNLMSAGLPATLHFLTRLSDDTATSSGNTHEASREMLGRVYLAAVEKQENRGVIVQQGGIKALLSLSTKNTIEGKHKAGQAIAKIAITMNPQVAFPGQRSLEVIKPLVNLLDIDNTGLQNFEGLMALTNLSSVDDNHRRRILTEKGLSKIENYMYDEHEDLCRAAVQCICNMVQNEQVQNKYLTSEDSTGDRVKVLLLYCLDLEDPKLIVAASGALAILSEADSELLRNKIVKVENWLEILQTIMASEDTGIRQRGVYIVRNLILGGNEDFCRFLVNSTMLDVLMAIEKHSRTERNKSASAEWTKDALRKLVSLKLIMPIPEITQIPEEEEEGAE